MHALITRIEDLYGLHIRLHLTKSKFGQTVDGICQGIQEDCVILEPSTLGERAAIPLEQIGALTQLPGDFGAENPLVQAPPK
jgi:hypothetical protein